jgi:integrase
MISKKLKKVGDFTRRQRRIARMQVRKWGAADLAPDPSEKPRRVRTQKGVEVAYADGYYVRYYKRNEQGEPVRMSHRIGDLTMDKLDRIRAIRAWMKDVNADARRAIGVAIGEIEEDRSITIGEYYRSHYKPAIDEGRKSTALAYDKVWRGYCEAKLDGAKLAAFGTGDAKRFLEPYYRRLNRNTLSRVKSVLSGLFTHAVGVYIETNPWREVKLDQKRMRRPKEQEHYTVAERDAILKVVKRLDAKVFFALCAVAGLNPSEAAAVKWQNIDLDAKPYPTLAITEAASYGILADTKRPQRKRVLLLVEPLLGLMREYHALRGKLGGLLFQRAATREVIDPYGSTPRHIRKCVRDAGLKWKGMYAARHGAITAQLNVTKKDVLSASAFAGNSPITIMKTYGHGERERAHAAQLATAEAEQVGKA